MLFKDLTIKYGKYHILIYWLIYSGNVVTSAFRILPVLSWKSLHSQKHFKSTKYEKMFCFEKKNERTCTDKLKKILHKKNSTRVLFKNRSRYFLGICRNVSHVLVYPLRKMLLLMYWSTVKSKFLFNENGTHTRQSLCVNRKENGTILSWLLVVNTSLYFFVTYKFINHADWNMTSDSFSV